MPACTTRTRSPKRCAAPRSFAASVCPSSLQWFESILLRNPAGSRHLVGGKLSYADLSLLQVVEGLRYAFPRAAQSALAKAPAVVQLHERVGKLPKVAAYLRSDRRIAFNEQGIFRCYPELDIQ